MTCFMAVGERDLDMDKGIPFFIGRTNARARGEIIEQIPSGEAYYSSGCMVTGQNPDSGSLVT